MSGNQTTSVAAQLAALPSLPMKDLWALWDQHFPRRPSHRNRNYVESRLAYRIQELAYGALPAGIRRHLVDAGAKHSKIKTAAGRGSQLVLMPGTTLFREWDERGYRVVATPEGLYEWRANQARGATILSAMLRKRRGFSGWARVVARLTGRESSDTFMIREKGRLKFLYPLYSSRRAPHGPAW